MQLFKIILFEYILGYVLQGFALVIGIYAFNRTIIDKKRFLITSIAFILVSYATRMLPISFGVHTILDMIFLFMLFVLYIKFPAINTIKSLLLITLFLVLTEMLNVFAMTSILGKEQFNLYMSSSPERNIVGLPSAILFALLMSSAYLFNKKRINRHGTKS